MVTEKTICAWPVRGPRVLNRITQFDYSTGGQHHATPAPTPAHSDAAGPLFLTDIVGLQEYSDETLQQAVYLPGTSEEMNFRKAMHAVGYDGAHFPKPAGASLAIFWRKDVFRVDSVEEDLEQQLSQDVKCGGSIGDAVFNYDLECTWHALSNAATPVLMKRKERKGVGLVRLVHREHTRAGGHAKSRLPCKVWVVVTHLMTTR